MSTPRVSSYYRSRPNAVCVELADRTLWFSYSTLVAFQFGGHPRVVHENIWSNTTGRHLAAIDSGSREAKGRRVGANEFAQRWEEMTARFNALTRKDS
jgi:hypothetical protein